VNHLQKKCMIFSLGLHGLLGVIMFASAGFRNAPPPTDLQIMTLLPANIVDRDGAGGGTPMANPAPLPPAPPQAQPQAQPPPPQPRPQPQQEVRIAKLERNPTPTPRLPKEAKLPKPEETDEAGLEPAPKPARHSSKHEIQVSYEPANAVTNGKKTDKKSEPTESSESSARSTARHLKSIQNLLDQLATDVRGSGSPGASVDVAGIGGGEAFAGYRDAVYSAYYHAWTTPDSTASRTASADAKVTIARNGSVVSAELVRSSADRALDKSVEQALRRVTKLPPFPASARDTERTFMLRFSPEAKEMSE
jgi:TonB family protein